MDTSPKTIPTTLAKHLTVLCDKPDQAPTIPTNTTMLRDPPTNHQPTRTRCKPGAKEAHRHRNKAHSHHCGMHQCMDIRNHLQSNRVRGLARVPLTIPTNQSNRTMTTTTRTPHPQPLRPTMTMNLHLTVCLTSPPCPTLTLHLRSICSTDVRRNTGGNLPANQ